MIQTGGDPCRRPLPALFMFSYCLFQFVSLPHVLTFILILFMFMFKTSTPSSAKTLNSRPCLSPKGPPPGSSDPLIKPSSPAVCPEPSSSPKHVSSVTPRTGGSGAKEMKVKVRKTPPQRTRLLSCGFLMCVSFSRKDLLQISSYLEAPHRTVGMGMGPQSSF